jgi:hypothetical protein
MKTPAHIFREYDVRGLVEEDLSDDLVRARGRVSLPFARRESGSEYPRSRSAGTAPSSRGS